MDETLARLFSSKQVATIDNNAIVAYLILRADISNRETIISKSYRKSHGLLVSGLDMQLVAQRSGVSDITINRVMLELFQKEWVRRIEFSKERFVYQLGFIDKFDESIELHKVVWFANKAVEKPKVLEKGMLPSTIVKKWVKESRRRIAAEKEARTVLTPEYKYKKAIEVGIAKPKKYQVRLLDRYKEY